MKTYSTENSLKTTLAKIRSALNEHSALDLGKHLNELQVHYPDKNWNTWTWSHLLLRDFEYFSKTSLVNIIIFKIMTFFRRTNLDKNSAHLDFSRKIYLYSLLRKHSNKETIIIPECGPCGFEIFIALLAGYKKVIAYDIEERFINCAYSIYSNVEFHISTSSKFDFEQFNHFNPTIIVPDWDHDNLISRIPNSFLLIKYADKNSFKSHLSKISLSSLLKLQKQLLE